MVLYILHSRFNNEDLTAWKAYKIGDGKKVKENIRTGNTVIHIRKINVSIRKLRAYLKYPEEKVGIMKLWDRYLPF